MMLETKPNTLGMLAYALPSDGIWYIDFLMEITCVLN